MAFNAAIGINMQGEIEGSIQASKTNFVGAGETVRVELMKARSKYLYNASASMPFARIIGSTEDVYKSQVGLSCYRSLNQMPWTKADVMQNGATLEYKGPFYTAQLGYTGREFLLRPDAPPPLRFFPRFQPKFSLEHSVAIVDTRDRLILPSSGGLIKVSQELAALSINAGFIKHQLDVQAAIPLFAGLFAATSFRSVAIKAFGDGGRLHPLDRTYLGGPFNLRGFNENSIGQRVGAANVGGSASCFAAAHLYAPLVSNVFGHGFVTAGSVVHVDSQDAMGDLPRRMRLTAGAGLTLLLSDSMQAELNYVVPIKKQAGDVLSERGKFQLGIGVEFL